MIRLAPPGVVEACRARSVEASAGPRSNLAAVLIVATRVCCAVGFGYWLLGA